MRIKSCKSGMLWMCVVVLTMCVSMLAAEPECRATKEAKANASNISGRVVAEETGLPIADALVRIAVPSIDMRSVRVSSNHTLYETRTNKEGQFSIRLPMTEEQNVSIDAFAAGYRSGSGTFMAGGDPLLDNIPIRPGQAETIEIRLPKAFYVKGIVKDEQGNVIVGVKVEGQLYFDNGYGCIATAETNSQGIFEMFDFPLVKKEHERGKLIFKHPKFQEISIPDVYQIERSSLEVVLPKGLMISGTVLKPSGKPAANIKVEAGSISSCGIERECLTDSQGQFKLVGLRKFDSIKLVSYTSDFNSKATQILSPFDQDYNAVILQLKPCDIDVNNPVALFGMTVADVTPQLKDKFDVWDSRGVVILDPGNNSASLGIGELKAGYFFWMIGNKKIVDLKDMIGEILRIHAKPKPELNPMIRDGYHGFIRVVYGQRQGNNTQYLELTDEQADELRQVGKSLEMTDAELNPPSPEKPNLTKIIYDCNLLQNSLSVPPQNASERLDVMKQIVDEIQKIEPQSWNITDGDGVAMFTETSLIILQTQDMHEQIRAYLDKKAGKSGIVIETPFPLNKNK